MAFTKYLKEMDETRFNAIGEFVFDVMFFAVQVHAWHLQTGSYAAHMALNDLYTGLPDLADGIAEALIGIDRKLVLPTKPYTFIQDNTASIDGIVAAINSFKGRATQLFSSTNDEAGINNTLADIVSLLDKTVYKLKNLK
jgi:DNA-binding ferritin-like protein